MSSSNFINIPPAFPPRNPIPGQHVNAKEMFLDIERIAGILGKLQVKKITNDIEKHIPSKIEEDAILRRICRCEVQGNAESDYTSELDHRLNANEQESNDNQKLLYNNSLAGSNQFDLGFIGHEPQGKRLLWIISPALKMAVERLLMPHWAIYSGGGIICIPPPYDPFIHKYAEIKDFLNSEFSEELGPKAWLSLDYFMKQNAPKYIWQAPRDFQKGAKISYEELWTLFRPKDRVVVSGVMGNKEILQFISMNISLQPNPGPPNRPPSPPMFSVQQNYKQPVKPSLDVFLWGISRDKYSEKLKLQKYRVLLAAFEGTRSITSLNVYPIRYIENEDDEAKFLEKCQLRGHVWRSLNSVEQGKSYYYEGTGAFRDRGATYQQEMRTEHISDRLVIAREDPKTTADDREHIQQCFPLLDKAGLEIYLNEDGQVDFESYAFLCPSTVRVVDIKKQKYYLIEITNDLRKVEWNKDLFTTQLIIPSAKKHLLEGLVGNRLRGTYKRMGDMIDAKGRGLIVLLHGPPGTGKTFVAEAIAEYFERPLRALSIGELIADHRNLEENLTEMFAECKRWNAILLLDEADVVLEARSYEDISRNAIVSTFLRNLEYFEGIMFLTTNRIGTIDEAFMSRIQIAIHMDSLQKGERRRLWGKFFGAPSSDKEADEKANEKLFLTPDSRRTILEHIDEWAEMNLNGREIRNTINIAQSLAYTRNGKDGFMSPRDVRDAAAEAIEFRTHLSTAKEESDRAASSVWGGGGYGRQ